MPSKSTELGPLDPRSDPSQFHHHGRGSTLSWPAGAAHVISGVAGAAQGGSLSCGRRLRSGSDSAGARPKTAAGRETFASDYDGRAHLGSGRWRRRDVAAGDAMGGGAELSRGPGDAGPGMPGPARAAAAVCDAVVSQQLGLATKSFF
jgi:hypothetical protein